MVPLATSRPRRVVRRRDFATTTHRAPQTVTRLAREFYQPPQHRTPHWLWWAAGLMALAAVAIAAASPLFTIRNVVVNNIQSPETAQRVRELVAGAISQPPYGFLPGNNLIFFSASQARAALAREFVASGLSFSRHWPNVLKVSLGQSEILVVWRCTGGTYLADATGRLVQQLEADAWPPPLPLVQDSGDKHCSLGDSVTKAEVVGFVRQFATEWSSTLPDLFLDHFELDASSLPSMRVYTGQGWYALVSAQADLATQLTAIQRLLNEKVKDQAANLEYLDVRFGSRLYVKTKS